MRVWSLSFRLCRPSCKQKLKDALEFAEAQPKPDPESLFEDVYMNPTPQLRAQRDELLRLGAKSDEQEGEFPL